MSGRGVIIDFDFTVLNGSALLFATARKFLKKLVAFDLDVPTEARFLVGRPYRAGLEAIFQQVRTRKTAEKAARDFAAVLTGELNRAVPTAVTPAFRNFVNALTSAGIKVFIVTRADIHVVQPAFGALLGGSVSLCPTDCPVYGSLSGDVWRGVCVANAISRLSSVAITGSGVGVKEALLYRLHPVAVIGEHVAYQDFGGASCAVKTLNAAAARCVLKVLKV